MEETTWNKFHQSPENIYISHHLHGAGELLCRPHCRPFSLYRNKQRRVNMKKTVGCTELKTCLPNKLYISLLIYALSDGFGSRPNTMTYSKS